MLIGYYIVKAEPAVQVLTKQVEEVSNGSISQGSMELALSISVCVSVGLAMGACSAAGGNMAIDAFGIVSMVAMTPLVTIQVMGIGSRVYHSLNRRHMRYRLDQMDNDLRGAVTSGGIAFSVPLTGLSNLVLATIAYKTDLKKGDNKMSGERKGENSLILITCNQGTSDVVMETAKRKF